MSKIKNGGLDQYGPEHFEVQPFDISWLERVNGIGGEMVNRVQPRRQWPVLCDTASIRTDHPDLIAPQERADVIGPSVFVAARLPKSLSK